MLYLLTTGANVTNDNTLPMDADVMPECPATMSEHSPYEATTYPDYHGRCEVFWVCEECGEQLGHAGWDSVL